MRIVRKIISINAHYCMNYLLLGWVKSSCAVLCNNVRTLLHNTAHEFFTQPSILTRCMEYVNNISWKNYKACFLNNLWWFYFEFLCINSSLFIEQIWCDCSCENLLYLFSILFLNRLFIKWSHVNGTAWIIK